MTSWLPQYSSVDKAEVLRGEEKDEIRQYLNDTLSSPKLDLRWYKTGGSVYSVGKYP